MTQFRIVVRVRTRGQQGGLTVQAVAGNHAVFLAFDLTPDARAGCLGFGLHRTDHTENEAYWLSGFKTFRSVVPNPTSTTVYTSDKHPVQSMWWGDYSAKPAHRYTYKIVAFYGLPKNLTSTDTVSVSIEVTTNDPDSGTHGVYFNRGVAASQAYATKFGDQPSRLPEAKREAAMVWLSRGLDEALRSFITKDASPQVAIRAAVYEFTEPTIFAALAEAQAAGADVQIVYHDKGDQGATNDKAISDANLDRAILIPRQHPVIAHNKFIVRCDRDDSGHLSAQQVWTGSTNLSRGGIFGHSNVGHVVRDPQVATAFLHYWTAIAADPTGATLKAWVNANSRFDADQLARHGIHTLFSPRTDIAPLDWYARGFSAAGSNTHITLPFGMDNHHFEPLVTTLPADGALRFVTLNKRDDNQDSWARNPSIQVAVGSSGGPDVLARWAKETLTGFNPMVPYLHTKILLLGALTASPTTISGSANFSQASTTSNDENMLVIVGDLDVADVYFTEYARIFQHFYARWWAAQLDPQGTDEHSFLTEDAGWQTPYWSPRSPKNALRDLYANNVEGNRESP